MLVDGNVKKFSIYKASAGSGKTYTLTYNYIKLVLLYPEYFKSILAVTFTNKATDEMKSRIISTLHELSNGEHPMSESLKNELSIDDVELKKRSKHRLKTILHNYSFFAVTTIDAFFQKVVRSFAKEIGIHTGFSIELDQNKVLEEVIQEILMNLGKEPELISWLTSFAIYQINQGKSWDTNRQILSLSKELFKEQVMLNKNKLFQHIDEPSFMKDFIDHVKNEIETFESEYQSLGAEAVAICSQYGLSAQSFTYGLNGVGGYIFKVASGEIKEVGTRIKNALDKDAWVAKSSPEKETVAEAVSNGLEYSLAQMVEYYQTNSKQYFTLKQAFNYLYTYGLLSRVTQEIDKYKEENETLLISDFQLFLREIIHDSDSPYIYEKIGSRYKHFLIDEFQDTSAVQWGNFLPLIKDSLASGNFNMVVGDIKQSIYRWRGGNWKILLNQLKQDINQSFIKEESLLVNRRSKRNVVAFNNAFFDNAPVFIESKLGGDHVGLEVAKAYYGSEQEFKDEEVSGCVQLDFYNSKALEEKESYATDKLIANIQSLQAANYRLNDIAVLVRSNSDGRKVTEALMAYALAHPEDSYRYDIISNESLYLRKNKAVHFILQAITFITNPNEPLYKRQLDQAMSVLGLEWQDRILDWRNYTLSNLVHIIIEAYELLSISSQIPYLMAFQDAVKDFMKYGKDTLVDFEDWWSKNSNRSIQVAADLDAMQLMTIHKSKGLQFKAVIIPFCNWSMDHIGGMSEQLLWCDTKDSKTMNRIPLLPMKYGSAMANSEFEASYYQEKHDIHLDNLNMLYVALTRAEEYLNVICNVDPKSKGALTAAYLLFKHAEVDDLIGDESFETELGVQVGSIISQIDRKENNSSEQAILSRNGGNIRAEKIMIRHKAILMEDDQIASMNYGDIVHWIFSKITVKSDFNSAIESAKRRFGLGNQELDEIRQRLRKIWDMPGVSNWFSDQWEVKNESSILLTSGQMKRPDRVISKGERAIIIDYKTGVKSDGHMRQVREYKSLLKQMGYQEVLGYLIYFSNPEVVAV